MISLRENSLRSGALEEIRKPQTGQMAPLTAKPQTGQRIWVAEDAAESAMNSTVMYSFRAKMILSPAFRG